MGRLPDDHDVRARLELAIPGRSPPLCPAAVHDAAHAAAAAAAPVGQRRAYGA